MKRNVYKVVDFQSGDHEDGSLGQTLGLVNFDLDQAELA